MTERQLPVTRWGAFVVALGAALWAVDAPIRKPLADLLPATSIVFAEHLFLALYAIPVLLWQRRALLSLSPRGWLALFVIAWGASGLATVLFTAAFRIGNPTTVILLQKVQPLIAVLLAAVLLREQLPRLYWPCFVAALAGAYLVSFGRDVLEPLWLLPRERILTALLALGAAALWGSATVLGRYVLGTLSFPTLAAARFLFALPFLAGLALFEGTFVRTFTVGLAQYAPRLSFLALVPGLAAMLIYYLGLRHTRASYATLAELAFPALAIVVNWLTLGATIDIVQLAGFVLLWTSITVLSWIPAPTPASEPRPATPLT
ncbi:DMT family transporter [Thermomicrobium sp. 4228-Ro]|uniref:DMT family transporter n=1 Tax=Thermomicrobium sp. 4228-Ro TaxID=2993937 RepID=UPI002249108B|nr:DMT family transporter [Thermomicrobium sp. 4228-Ro]MCX2727826.1 DMT family transporter [Thermomicrobium sp. 4228-Ro]